MSKKIYNLNSKDRISGTSSKFEYRFKLPADWRYFNGITVTQVEIPKSFYLIDQTNNDFYLTDTSTAGAIVTLPLGQYNANSLAAALVTVLNATSSQTYEVTYETTTDKFNIVQNPVVDTDFSINILSTNTNLAKILGMAVGVNTADTNLISPNVAILQKTATVKVHSNMAINNDDDLLCEVYAGNVASGSVFSFENRNGLLNSVDFSSRSDTFRFTLLDENNEEINMNGVDWYAQLILYGCKETGS